MQTNGGRVIWTADPEWGMAGAPENARQEALELATETMGELMAFWGFKASMGRIWTLLYLSAEPLPADEIARLTGLSSGAVSMAVADLQKWGIVERAPKGQARKRHYRAETDVWGIVKRIFRERELRLVGRAVDRFGRAAEVLEASLEAHPEDEDARFMLERVRGLLGLARTGYALVEGFAKVGHLTLEPIRGALSRHGRGGG